MGEEKMLEAKGSELVRPEASDAVRSLAGRSAEESEEVSTAFCAIDRVEGPAVCLLPKLLRLGPGAIEPTELILLELLSPNAVAPASTGSPDRRGLLLPDLLVG
jgi:hypothetical protein